MHDRSERALCDHIILALILDSACPHDTPLHTHLHRGETSSQSHVSVDKNAQSTQLQQHQQYYHQQQHKHKQRNDKQL